MGRAFSIHTFAGHLGSAVAPATVIFLAAIAGWRGAMLIVGLAGLVVVVGLSTQWNVLHDEAQPRKKDRAAEAPGQAGRDGLALLLSVPMLLFFLFFAMISMTSTGMQAFSVAALVTLHDMPLATASAGLTAYLFCSAAGVLLGGYVADRTSRHDLVAAAAFVVTIVFVLVLAAIALPLAILMLLMTVMGLGQGMVRPARDMLLRAVAPKGSAGKVFGFVSAGIAAGSAIAPIPFGMLLDAGRPQWVFYLIALFMLVALVTVLAPKRRLHSSSSPSGERSETRGPSSV
jgi:MFS family permease